MMTSKNNLLNVDFLIDKVISADNEKIADLGCGSFGYFTFPLAKKISRYGKVYAVDILKSNLESIKNVAKTENLSQIETIWSNLEIYRGTKIEDASLDAVLLVSILHQSEKYIDILKESARMLKLGGRMLIIEWNEGDFTFSKNNSARIKKSELKKELEKMPLDLIEDFSAGRHHYGLLLIKK
ncbi:MAG: methyltransferase domain-containing protein [Patescibacteria group bacterium]|nr:methyltransferase domain-containing protein [Patescibacteria group bacterium]